MDLRWKTAPPPSEHWENPVTDEERTLELWEELRGLDRDAGIDAIAKEIDDAFDRGWDAGSEATVRDQDVATAKAVAAERERCIDWFTDRLEWSGDGWVWRLHFDDVSDYRENPQTFAIRALGDNG